MMLCVVACALLARQAGGVPRGGRETVSFNYAYRFKHGASYPQYRPSGTSTPNISTAPERLTSADDSGWELLDVPHDMLIGGVMAQKGDRLESACLPRGDGWYRKHFSLPTDWQGRRAVWLAFEGVWQRTTMFLNGRPLLVDRTSSFEPCTADNPGTAASCANGTAGFYTGHFEGDPVPCLACAVPVSFACRGANCVLTVCARANFLPACLGQATRASP